MCANTTDRTPGPALGGVCHVGEREPWAVLAVAERVLTAVKSKPGMSVAQICAGLKLRTKDLVLPIRKLVEAKKVKTKGRRRGTRYFAW